MNPHSDSQNMSFQETVTIYTDELPEIPPLIVNANLPARVTIRGALSVIRNIKNVLPEEYQTEFRRWPQMGRLIDLPTTGNFSGTLVHQLLLRKMACKKNQELWFSLNGKPARFSLNEFVLVTGLYTTKFPSKKKGNDLLKDNRLMAEHWPEKKSVTVSQVYATLRALRNTETDDRVKLAFVYLVAGFLLAREPEMPVPSWILSYGDDLEFFDSFPWGKICYGYLIDELSGVDMEDKYRSKKNKGPHEYTILACPWILQVWAYEAIPKLGEVLATRDPENTKPRWLSWRTKELSDAKFSKYSVEVLDSAEFPVRPTLQPSLDEKRETYYERLRILKDDDDHVIDCLTRFLSRDIILSSRNLSSERGEKVTHDGNNDEDLSPMKHVRELTLMQIVEKSNPKQPVRGSTPMQRVEDSTLIQRVENSNLKQPVRDSTPMQRTEDSTPIQRVEKSNPKHPVRDLTPMHGAEDSTLNQEVEESTEDSTPIQRAEKSNPKHPVRDSTPMQRAEDSTPIQGVERSTEDSTLIQRVEKSNPKHPVRDSTPMQRAEDSTPIQGVEKSTEDSTLIQRVEKSNPKHPVRDSTPMQIAEDSTPIQGVEKSTEDSTLIQRVEKSNLKHPVRDSTPMQIAEDSTPIQRVEKSNPKQPVTDSTPVHIAENSTTIQRVEKSNQKQPVRGSTPMQIAEGSTSIQRVEKSNQKQPVSDSTPMQRAEDSTPIQRVEKSNQKRPVRDSTPMQRAEDSTPIQRVEKSNSKHSVRDSTRMQRAEDSTSIRRMEKSNSKKPRNSSESAFATKVSQLQHLKKHIDRSLKKQESKFRSLLEEQNSSNDLRIRALSSDFSELKESHKMVIGKLDLLIDMFDPRRSHMGEQQEILMLENAYDQVHSHHGPNDEQNGSSNSEDGIADPDRETYVTPDTIIYDSQEEVERGDEVTSVILRGREVRIRKRPRNNDNDDNKKIRHVKSNPPIFDPFREADLEQVQAFQRWFGCDTNGVAAIRCGLTSQWKQFFDDMFSPQCYINSEHVDEVLYLFRKRIQTFRDSFPNDICILSDDFGQIVTSLYKDCESMKRTRSQKLKYPFTEELLKFTRGERPRRGRPWSSKVKTFYVPWNHNSHWILLVVDVLEWAIWVYDSVPSHWSSINQLKKDLRPFCEYFSFLLEKCQKFRSQEQNFGSPMVVRVPPNSKVPRNVRTGDCGVYMLKTMEMHMANMCDETATTLLNDNNIQEVRQSYAIQLYFNNASI